MAAESTGPPQSPDQLPWPSPPKKMLSDASLSTSALQVGFSTAPPALSVSGFSDLAPVPTTSQRGHAIHNYWRWIKTTTALTMSPSNLSNNSVTSTPKIQPPGWTGLHLLSHGNGSKGGQEVKAHCTRTRCTHEHTQNGEPTCTSSGPSGWQQQSAGTRVAAEEPSHLELQRRATFLAESTGAMTSELPVMHPGAASGLLPRLPPFSHCPFQGSYSQIRSSENTQILGLLRAL